MGSGKRGVGGSTVRGAESSVAILVTADSCYPKPKSLMITNDKRVILRTVLNTRFISNTCENLDLKHVYNNKRITTCGPGKFECL